MSITINSNILTQNDCYKAGRTITPKGIMVHSTATPGATANNFITSWNKSGVLACPHAFIDNTGIYQTLPWNWRGWHAASGVNGSANNTHISFEICEPGGFKYSSGANMIGYNIQKNEDYFNNVYQKAVELCAYLCKKYGLTENNIICHSEGYTKGIASNHGDVMHWFPKHNKNMDIFRNDVKTLLNGRIIIESQKKEPTDNGYDIYKVTASVLNVRNGAGTSYAVAYQLSKEDYVEVVSIDNNWAKLRDGKYVSADWITLYKKTTVNEPDAWAKESWEKAVKKGILDGTNPRNPLTREQLSAVLFRLGLV